ncbi:hypothetical protein AB0G73_10820 [Streptomyces sp. NPDC020719]|uniref:hypothetical protein n=1 Tax=Streptomyces sp. NPDC020719 TaxID=3154896 RepID=UPI00340C79B5
MKPENNNLAENEPTMIDLDHHDDFKQLVFYFVHRVNPSGSMPFACWTRDATRAVLYSAEGAEREAIDIDASAEPGVADVIALVRDAWGPLSYVKFSSRVYE